MTDTSSQNPFDPVEKPDHENSSPEESGLEAPQPKLTLKQLLKPLSPHLKVEQTEKDDRFKEFKPRMEIPRAVPIDPEPELAPHERPPSPDGTPLDMLGTEPGLGGQSLPAHGIEPHTGRELTLQKNRVHESVEPPEEEQENEEMEELVSTPAPKPGRFRKIALPVAAVLAAVAAIQYFLDPLGLSIDPIKPAKPVVVEQAEQVGAETEMPASMAPVALSLELDNITVESFLGLLEKQVIIASEQPRGAIIDSVFYPEGSKVNPELGLVLSSVEKASIRIADSSGKEYKFPAN